MDIDLSSLNENKFFIGTMMVLLNLGGKHIVDEFSDKSDEYDRNILFRRIAIFAICFIATRDILTSVLLTAAFIIIASGVSFHTHREKMSNKHKLPKHEPENPAYDSKAEPLFKKE